MKSVITLWDIIAAVAVAVFASATARAKFIAIAKQDIWYAVQLQNCSVVLYSDYLNNCLT